MQSTINKLNSEFQIIANEHEMIHDYFFGTYFEAMNSKTLEYPCMIVTQGNSIPQDRVMSITFSFIFVDKYDTDNYDQKREIWSDQNQIIAHLKATFNSPRWRRYMNYSFGTAEPIDNRGQDVTNGWVVPITFEIVNYEIWCAVPYKDYDFDADTQNLPVCAPASYTVEYANGDPIQSGTIPSGGSKLIEVADCPNPKIENMKNSYFLSSFLSQDINFGSDLDSIFWPSGNLDKLSLRLVYRPEILNRQETLLGKWQGSNRGFIIRKEVDGRYSIFFSRNGGTGNNVVIKTTNPVDTDTQWKDVWFTIDNSKSGLDKFKLYVNGPAQDLTLDSGTISTANIQVHNSTVPLTFGQFNNAVHIFGYFNQFGATNDVVTPAEVSSMYNSGEPINISDAVDNVIMNAYGGFFDGTNYTMPDHSINNFNGTSTNMDNYGLNKNISPYNDEVDAALFNGQSNCRGDVDLSLLPADQQGEKESFNVYFETSGTPYYRAINSNINNNQWGQPLGSYGIEFEFLKLRYFLNYPLNLLKFGVGGTSLATQADGGTATNWNVNTVGSLFDDLDSYIDNTINYWAQRGVNNVIFDRWIWLHGTNDAQDATAAGLYYQNLTDLANALITKTGNPNLKIDIIEHQNTQTYSPTVIQAQIDFVNDDPANRTLISSSGVTTSDGVHYDKPGNELMGGRVVDNWKLDL